MAALLRRETLAVNLFDRVGGIGQSWKGERVVVLHDSKDNVSLVLYRGESDGCYHHNHEVESLHTISFDVETDPNQIWCTYPIGRC